MRNLKRALSLTLASVMLLGMMVVGAGAAGFPDVTEENNVEAIEVLQAVEVMIGDDNGNFGPNDLVNRSQMAVVMANLLNLDYKYYEASCPFWDVPTWARPYVGACYANKIVSGYGDGTYGAADSVTAVQAASMMMRALGYFKYDSDYKDGFETATVRQGTRIGIFKGLTAKSDEPLTRNDVAQMALNALKTPVVEPDDNTINIVDGNGNLVASGGQVNYVVIASNQSYAKAIDRTEYVGNGLNQVQGYTVELGEQLYDGKLKLNDDIDPFNRPARAWEYNGKTIGLYAKEELMEFENVGTVTGKDLYDLLGKTVIDDYSLEVALDGVTDPEIVRNVRGMDTAGGKKNVDFVFDKDDINRSNNGSLGATGTGVLTQVFVDPDYDNGGSRPDGKVWIAVINTYLARANQDYDTRREELALNAYSVQKSSNEYVKLDKDSASVQVRLGVDEFPAIKDAKESTAFLLTFAEGEVQSAVPAEVLSGVTVSSFKVKDNVVVDGTTYKFTTTAGWDADALKAYTGNDLVNLKDRTYNIFLDAYGNLIGVQEVDAVKNYVFIAALDLNDSNLVNGTADAKAIFLDGTVDTIRVNMNKSTLDYYTKDDNPGGFNKNSILNTWCTYTKNNSDVYTVKQVTDVTTKGDAYIPSGDANSKNTTGLAQYHQTAGSSNFSIDKKHITLNGKSSNSGEYARVYGNEKTVYLTAELTNLTNQGGTWGVIKDVDTVITGIENANLSVWTDAEAVSGAETTKVKLSAGDGYGKVDYASKGVYTLYDDDGVVIAAVVVGEDDGTARNLVYVHSGSVDYEAWNGSSSSRASGDGLWTWTRKVISNGQEVTLTEVSDGNSDLAAMQQYHWYQIKTNGSGEVTGAYRLPGDDKAGNLPEAKLSRYDDFALDYKPYTDDKGVTLGEIAYTVQNGASTVLYWNEDYIESQLSMNGRTLYVATDDQTGFIVNSNVKWVVQQWDNNAKETYIDEGTTANGLKNMIDELNRRNTNRDGKVEKYHYQVSAVIESGIASSVVIYYNENDYNRPNGGATTQDGVVYLDKDLAKANVGTIKDSSIETLANGNVYATFTLTKPSWAYAINSAANDTVEIEYQVYLDGELYAKTKGTIGNSNSTRESDSALVPNKSGNKNTATAYTITDYDVTQNSPLTASDAKGHTVELVITKVDWKQAAVEYTLNGEDAKLRDSDNGPDLYLSTDEDSAKKMHFALDVEKINDAVGSFTVSGVMIEGEEAINYSETWTGSTQKEQHTDEMWAVGGKPVKVDIKMETEIINTYYVTLEDSLDSGVDLTALNGYEKFTESVTESGKLTLAAGTTEVKEGESTIITVTVDKIDDPRVLEYKVFVSINGQEKPLTVAKDKKGTIAINDIKGDITIGKDDIRVEAVKKAEIVSATATETTLTLTFSEPLMRGGSSSGVTEGGGKKSVTTLSEDGRTVTITFEGFDSLPRTHIYSWIKDGEKGGWWRANGDPVVDCIISVVDGEATVALCDQTTHTKPVVGPSTPQTP